MADFLSLTTVRAVGNWFQTRHLPMTAEPRVVSDLESDEAVIARLLSTNDPTLFTIIVTRYRSKLTALARTTLSGTALAAEAEDVVQDTFVAAYDNLVSFRTAGSFRPWLYRIMLNRCVDKLRRSRIVVDMPFDCDQQLDESPGPLEIVLRKEKFQSISEAVATLPPRLRAIFILRYIENLSYSELANVTGLPEGTVKTCLFRARAAVKRAVASEAPE